MNKAYYLFKLYSLKIKTYLFKIFKKLFRKAKPGENSEKFKTVEQKDFQLLTDPDIYNLFH